MEVTLVTSNRGKFAEARAILEPYGVTLEHRPEPIPEIQADTLGEVVRAKLAAVRRSRAAMLVEDSGLFIPSLGGFPGVYSAYIYRIWGFDPLLELLRRRERTAEFRTVAGLRLGRAERTFTGSVEGTIARHPRGESGFGFDPIFLPRGKRRTFAELGPAEKNALSHRGQALRKVGRFLQSRGTNRSDRNPHRISG